MLMLCVGVCSTSAQTYINFAEEVIQGNNEPLTVEDWFDLQYGKESGFSLRLVYNSNQKISSWTHETYQMYYKNVPIEFCVINAHSKNGIILSLNGGRADGTCQLDTLPVLSQTQCCEIAGNYNNQESTTARVLSCSLVFCPELWQNCKTIKLAYKIAVKKGNSISVDVIYVDATNGNIIYSQSQYFGYQGAADTWYSGRVSIETSYDTGEHQYYLYDESRNIRTGVGFSIEAELTDICDNDNIWSKNEFRQGDLYAAFDAHWGAELTYDYFHETFNRQGYDTNGGLLTININEIGNDWAGWDNINRVMQLGRGSFSIGNQNGRFPLTSLDVVSHEYTHAVFRTHCHASNKGESGAVFEAVSDMFAMCVLNYANLNRNTDLDLWAPGIYFSPIGRPVRRMDYPRLLTQPEYYRDENWMYCEEDECDFVHHNSTVLSHWFYLLANKDSCFTVQDTTYHIHAIGFDDAEKIVYNAIVNYMAGIDSLTYSYFAGEILASTAELFGFCSEQYESANSAFKAVGVTPHRYGTYEHVLSISTIEPIDIQQMFAAGRIIATCTISGQQNVSFRADEEIKLEPGFLAQDGVTFYAKVNACEPSTLSNVNISRISPSQSNLESEQNKLQAIYYDPATERVVLQNLDNKELTCRIYDIQGKLALVGVVFEGSMSVENIEEGIYIVIMNDKGNIITGKFYKHQ